MGDRTKHGADIVKLPNPSDPEPDVVEMLEGWLARARSGELRAVACVGMTADRGVSTGYDYGDAPGAWIGLIGGLEVCKARLIVEAGAYDE